MENEVIMQLEMEEIQELHPGDIALLLLQNNRSMARNTTAEYLMSKYTMYTLKDTDEIVIYANGYYQTGMEYILKAEIKKLWTHALKKIDMMEIIDVHIKPKTYIDREAFNQDLDYTNVKNGIINLNTGELQPHNPKFLFTFQLPVKYDKDAKCPRTEELLASITEVPEDIQTIYEYYGYCLHRRYPKHKILTLLGNGRNGKSTIIYLLNSVLGKINVKAMSIHQIEHDPFMVSQLYGIHANTNPDVQSQRISSSGAIKRLTGGDFINANVKHGKPIQFTNFAKFVFGTNELPSCDDQSYAWASRWIMLRFPHNFDYKVCKKCHTIHAINDTLRDEIEADEVELSGLLNKMINALIQLKKNKWKFSLSDQAKTREEDYATISDPVKGFIEQCCDVDDTLECNKSDVYIRYKVFCEELGEQPLMAHIFSQRMKQHIVTLTDRRSGNNKFWVGFQLKPESIQNEINNF